MSAALAAAFQDDPVFRWLLPDPAARQRALPLFFELEARHFALRHGHSRAAVGPDGRVDGAVLALPPGRWQMPLRTQARYLPGYLRVFGRRLPRALGTQAVLQRHHLSEPHMFVLFVGVSPKAQGRGLGTALLRPVLAYSDLNRLPAYLEASSPESARLYERLGFRTTGELRPFGGPPLRLMRRAPAG